MNMKHCMFENTYQDLKECYESLQNNDIKDLEREANDYEKPYIRKLIKLCEEISNNFSDV